MNSLAVTRTHQKRTMCAPQLGPRTEKREFPARLLGLSFGGASTGMHMTKRDKPHLVSVPGGAHTAPNTGAALDEDLLWREVGGCLTEWRQWAAPVNQRGVMTPAQFLAVVLWAVQTEDTSEADEKLIVNRWARALLLACSRKIVVALHPVCLLPLERDDSRTHWAMSVAHAQDFLDSMPMGFNLIRALEYWRDEAAKPLDERPTLEQIAARLKSGSKGTRWPDVERQVVADAVAASAVAVVAKKLGVQPNTVRSAIKGFTATSLAAGRGPSVWSSLAANSRS